MAIKNTLLGGTDFSTPDDRIKPTDLNNTFDEVAERIEGKSTFNLAPIGSVFAWMKSLTNTPALPSNWVECNGQTISDADSVYDGVTIPDLNGGNRFLRGDSTSGSTGGTENNNHFHNLHAYGTINTGFDSGASDQGTNRYLKDFNIGGGQSIRVEEDTTDNKPPYYTTVWIMRIK